MVLTILFLSLPFGTMTDQLDTKNTPKQPIIERIHAYLEASGIAGSAFGKAVCGDVNLVATMGRGREVRRATADKIEAELAAGWARIKAKAPPGLFQAADGTKAAPAD